MEDYGLDILVIYPRPDRQGQDFIKGLFSNQTKAPCMAKCVLVIGMEMNRYVVDIYPDASLS
jgi:hypothetical protein